MFVCLSYLNGKTWTVAEQINLTWPSCSLKIRQETLLTQTDIWESESACSWWVELKVTSFRSFLVQVKWRNMLTWKNPTTATSYNHGACHYPLTAMVKTQNRKATPIHRKGGGRMSRALLVLMEVQQSLGSATTLAHNLVLWWKFHFWIAAPLYHLYCCTIHWWRGSRCISSHKKDAKEEMQEQAKLERRNSGYQMYLVFL